MALTDIEIAQAALVLLGSKPIASFTAQGNAADVLRTLYEPTVEAALTSGAWHWAKITKQLTRDATAPVNLRWAASYIVPVSPPVLLVKTVTLDDNVIPFDRYENRIHCDANGDDDTVYMEYMWRVAEADWPPDFTEYITFRLASVIAVPITGKPEIMNAMLQQADQLFLKAGHNTAAGRTTQKVKIRLGRNAGSRPNYRG
jgi:hypothetical protein